MHPAKAYAEMADRYTVATFRALVEAIVPPSPEFSAFGAEKAVGAVDLHVHEYMIWELDHTLALLFGLHLTAFPLSAPTAMLLNAGAAQFISTGQATKSPHYAVLAGGPFSALSRSDRIRTLEMLEKLNVDLGSLPPPYQNDGGLIKFMVDYLNRATMFGFYSEWSAYGSTRLETPVKRVLEYFPLSWAQVGYPGVSLGYRALRGFLLTIKRDGGKPIVI